MPIPTLFLNLIYLTLTLTLIQIPTPTKVWMKNNIPGFTDDHCLSVKPGMLFFFFQFQKYKIFQLLRGGKIPPQTPPCASKWAFCHVTQKKKKKQRKKCQRCIYALGQEATVTLKLGKNLGEDLVDDAWRWGIIQIFLKNRHPWSQLLEKPSPWPSYTFCS